MLCASSRITTAPWISIPCIWRVYSANQQRKVPFSFCRDITAGRHWIAQVYVCTFLGCDLCALLHSTWDMCYVQKWGENEVCTNNQKHKRWDSLRIRQAMISVQTSWLLKQVVNTPWHPGCSCRAWRSRQRQTSTHGPGSRGTFYTVMCVGTLLNSLITVY